MSEVARADEVAGLRFAVTVVLAGIGAGVGGAALTLLLHLLQHLVFGYRSGNFLLGVQAASGSRRVLAMTAGGALTGLGWWALRSHTRANTSVTEAVADPALALPVPISVADALLQIVAVAFGASLGREGAPRKVGAALAGWLGRRARLSTDQQRTLIACGAGAGLAAVYDVPLGGALFTIEVLLASTAARHVLPALLSSAIATAVAWPVVRNLPTYQFTRFTVTPAIVSYSILIGPIAAVVGVAFVRLTSRARSHPPAGWRLPVLTTTVFAAVGAVAIAYPQILGNGKGPAQLAFTGTLTVPLLAALLVLKPLATAACLRSGAAGGLLTPALAVGALLGALTAHGWDLIWPGSSPGVFAVIGAAAVLATTQRAPLTAIVLLIELTQAGPALLVPTMLAVAGAALTSQLLGSPVDSPRPTG